MELAIPKVRPGTYFPSLLQLRRRPEQALLTVGREAYVHGVLTRKVDDLVKGLGLDGISKSEVSRICGELDPLVEAFRTPRLTTEYPYVWLDATYGFPSHRYLSVSPALLDWNGIEATMGIAKRAYTRKWCSSATPGTGCR